ncbi:MAG: hypothetical protein QOJ59_2716 [Thermomicrobiales bacterium]|jgi:hypothetical protein|nr:hypothetical protein [Thermomicrobiales bacterium]
MGVAGIGQVDWLRIDGSIAIGPGADGSIRTMPPGWLSMAKAGKAT